MVPHEAAPAAAAAGGRSTGTTPEAASAAEARLRGEFVVDDAADDADSELT